MFKQDLSFPGYDRECSNIESHRLLKKNFGHDPVFVAHAAVLKER